VGLGPLVFEIFKFKFGFMILHSYSGPLKSQFGAELRMLSMVEVRQKFEKIKIAQKWTKEAIFQSKSIFPPLLC
jgi:hypothetical protein